jgi:hypothetical protein
MTGSRKVRQREFVILSPSPVTLSEAKGLVLSKSKDLALSAT